MPCTQRRGVDRAMSCPAPVFRDGLPFSYDCTICRLNASSQWRGCLGSAIVGLQSHVIRPSSDCLIHSSQSTRGTPAWMNALYWRKSRWRHTRSRASCAGHVFSEHLFSGQWKCEPVWKPIVMCSSRLQSAPSRNSTPDTIHGSGNCKALVNSEVVSITTKLPDRRHRLSGLTHTKQRKPFFYRR